MSDEKVTVEVSGFQIEWDLKNGLNYWGGIPTLSMWIPNSVAGLMSGLHRMVGTDRFNLCLQTGGFESVEGDWAVISQYPSFEEGVEVVGRVAGAAGWGRWEVASVDRAQRSVIFRCTNGWEQLYQKSLGVCWGSAMQAGKFAGFVSRLFGTPCWAEQTRFEAQGSPFDEFVVGPSDLTIADRQRIIVESGQATAADLASALAQLQSEFAERQRAEQELRAALTRVREQEEALRRVATPIIQIWDGVLTVPFMGSFDSERAVELMDSLLAEIVRSGARYAILDLTGVEIVDTSTADHLVRLVKAIELLGARAVITGIRALVAQAMVSLGLDLSRITTLRNLQEGLKACMRWLGQEKNSGAAKNAEAAPKK